MLAHEQNKGWDGTKGVLEFRLFHLIVIWLSDELCLSMPTFYISTNLFLWINVFESYIYYNINVYICHLKKYFHFYILIH